MALPDKVEIPANIIRTQPAKTRYQQSPRSTTDALTRNIPHELTFGTPTSYRGASRSFRESKLVNPQIEIEDEKQTQQGNKRILPLIVSTFFYLPIWIVVLGGLTLCAYDFFNFYFYGKSITRESISGWEFVEIWYPTACGSIFGFSGSILFAVTLYVPYVQSISQKGIKVWFVIGITIGATIATLFGYDVAMRRAQEHNSHKSEMSQQIE